MTRRNRSAAARLRIVWAALAVGACIPASQADALLGGCPCGVVSSLHGETRSHTTRATTQAAREVVAALQEQTKQNSRYLDRQVEAHKRIADGEAQNAALRLRDMFRAEAESRQFDPNPDFCLLMDASEHGQPGGVARQSRAAISESVADWTKGDAQPVREGGIRMAAWLAREREELAQIGGSEDATSDWNWVFNLPTAPATDPDGRRALARLLSNLVDPHPPKPLTADDLQTPAGLSEAARRHSIDARNGAALAAAEFAVRLRLPDTPSEAFKRIAGRSRYAEPIPDLISELQALDIRTSAYFIPDADTLELRHSKTERALLQDLVDIHAINARINYLDLEASARTAVAVAAIVGILTDGAASNLQLQ